jgi:hypothetical protein
MSFEIVDYSEKSIAVFGDVMKYQNEFLDLKGMLNEKLRYKGAVAIGFIFTKFKRPQVQDLVRKLKMLESNVNPDEEKGDASSSSTTTSTTSRIVQKTDDNVVLSREQFMNLVSTLNRLEQDVAFLKKQVLSHSSVSPIEKMVEKNEKNEKKTVIKVPAEKETKRVVKKEVSDDEKSGNDDDYSNDFDDDYNEEEDMPQSQGPSLLKLKKPVIKEEPSGRLSNEKKGPSLLRKK